jgi:transposase InsO family protein
MAWQARSIVSQREEFVALASASGACVSMLCERFGISRQTGYKWLRRARALGMSALHDFSRRPHTSPGKSSDAIEQLIIQTRGQFPVWGGRKIRAFLQQRGHADVPAASTITAILSRHGLIVSHASKTSTPWQRFEREQPNDLWQMDFKGPITTRRGVCHALTVLDDHSRFSLGVRACSDQRMLTVREQLTGMFERYGLPWEMLADNGPPWAGETGEQWTALKVWLLRLGVVMTHGRPYHPQTQGKDERFHRTLKAELLSRVDIQHMAHAQALFDPWRDVYNLERPHEALGLRVPASCYQPSTRAMPTHLLEYEPSPNQVARTVKEGGHVRYAGQRWYVGRAWDQLVLGLEESPQQHTINVYYGPYLIAHLNTDANPVNPVTPRVRLAPLARCAHSLREPNATS